MISLRSFAAAFAGCLLAGAAQAQISDDVVKIGILTDMSSLYADLGGPGSATCRTTAGSTRRSPSRRT